MMPRMPLGKISHRGHISLGIPLRGQVAYVVRSGWRARVHVRQPKHWLPDVCQRHQTCAAADDIARSAYL